jgi:hypothetical protein
LRAAVPKMIRMGMRNDGSWYRLPGIDMEVARPTIESLGSDVDERFGIKVHE